MKTKIYDVSKLTEGALERAQIFGEPEARAEIEQALAYIGLAGDVIRTGGLVAFPTETVYGLGADAMCEEAVAKVYRAKGRPSDNPMIVHIARASDIGLLTPDISPDIVRLADHFWPGPLTLVVKKKTDVPLCTTGGLDTVAVRLPDNPVAIELIRAAGTPVAAPSANISGAPSPTTAAHVCRDLSGKIDVILAGTDCRIGIESTVLDLSSEVPTVLRPGVLTAEMISEVLRKEVIYDPALLQRPAPEVASASASSQSAAREDTLTRGSESQVTHGALAENYVSDTVPRSPGMKYKHYAPNAEMLVIEGPQTKVRAEIERLRALNEQIGAKVGVLLFEEQAYLEAAHDFYAKLRALDEEGADLILAGALSPEGAGFAIMNRMLKSAGYRVITV